MTLIERRIADLRRFRGLLLDYEEQLRRSARSEDPALDPVELRQALVELRHSIGWVDALIERVILGGTEDIEADPTNEIPRDLENLHDILRRAERQESREIHRSFRDESDKLFIVFGPKPKPKPKPRPGDGPSGSPPPTPPTDEEP